MPKVTGLKLATAKKRIVDRHCRLGKVTKKTSSLVKKGRVLSQRPKGGTVLKKGARVNLRVSKGPRH